MLHDKYLPVFHFSEGHSVVIQASPKKIFSLVDNMDFRRSWIIRILFALRGIPASMTSLNGLAKGKFITLEVIPDQEIIIGLIGRFWKPTGDLQYFDPKEFTKLNQEGFAKACWNFYLTPEGRGIRLATETRIFCADENSRKKFSRYWFVIRPFSGIIRKEMLKAIKRQAED
ncbi:MAG TPA: hypothetical protein VGK59_09225 [Ohtaekwangia sp.]